jgi:GGDEF domain-containing protein
LGLEAAELEALRAASLLHDIGKIAVPEHILTKPGRLTALEVEKVRVHPRIGADILGAVPFPYPLAPVVRHHHERWDGTGYPDRLREHAIPLGARILAVVDCYDALTSDRPYRKALLKEEALAFLGQEAGRMFDPAVVAALLANIERLDPPGSARHSSSAASRFRPAFDRPAQASGVEPPSRCTEVIEDIRLLRETARVAGHQLGLDETLTLFSSRLAHLIPFQTLVVYLFDSDRRSLVARFATGTAADRLKGFVVPVGERLSGWVAVHERPYFGRTHATPLERDGSRSDLEDLFHDPEIRELRSSLLVPLVTEAESLGVLALYDTETGSYDEAHERLLVLLAGSLARAVRSVLQREGSRTHGLTDPWTGLPNSRFFFLEAEQRIASGARRAPGMGVLAFRMEGFAEIENAYGETAAERLATATARRLSSSCVEGESVARFAPDLFVVLTNEGRYQHLRDRSAALRLARPAERRRACQADSVELRLGVSGEVLIASALASYPRDGSSAEGLLDRLEAGLSHRHAAARRGAVVPFEPMRLRE